MRKTMFYQDVKNRYHVIFNSRRFLFCFLLFKNVLGNVLKILSTLHGIVFSFMKFLIVLLNTV